MWVSSYRGMMVPLGGCYVPAMGWECRHRTPRPAVQPEGDPTHHPGPRAGPPTSPARMRPNQHREAPHQHSPAPGRPRPSAPYSPAQCQGGPAHQCSLREIQPTTLAPGASTHKPRPREAPPASCSLGRPLPPALPWPPPLTRPSPQFVYPTTETTGNSLRLRCCPRRRLLRRSLSRAFWILASLSLRRRCCTCRKDSPKNTQDGESASRPGVGRQELGVVGGAGGGEEGRPVGV